jgi:polysaccharide pyruvyl transferase WcaK-like protein
VNRQIHVLADPAVVLRPAAERRVAAVLEAEGVRRPYAIVAPRRWFHYRHGFLPVSWQAPGTDRRFVAVEDGLASLADWLVEKRGLYVLFVPMYPGHGQGDEEVADSIRGRMRNADQARILQGDYLASELKGVFAAAELVLGVRLHSTILATSEGVPSMTLYYQRKGCEYFRLLGMADFALPISDIQWQQARVCAERLIEHREGIRRRLLERAAHLRSLAGQNVKVVRQVLEGQLGERAIR